MATKQTNFASQKVNELIGVVVGLQGDPANQDTSNNGISLSSAYNYINWSHAVSGDSLGVLFWSRVILVEILTPDDVNLITPRLALVLRPRAMWLYDKGGGSVADFMGNTTNASTIGTPTDTVIAEPKAPYKYGDIVHLAVLPAPVNLADWTEHLTRNPSSPNEIYNKDKGTGTVRSTTLNVSGLTINAPLYSAIYPQTVTPQQIIFYDKNLDARTRYGGTTSSGSDVTVGICLGGVTSIYKLKGQKIS